MGIPVNFATSNSVCLALWDSSNNILLGSKTIPLLDVPNGNREEFYDQQIRLHAVGIHRVGVDRSLLHVRFRCLELAEVSKLRMRIKDELDEGKHKLQQIRAYQEMRAAQEQAATNATAA